MCMERYNDDLMGLLTLNDGIQRGLQLKKRYNFSSIFADQKKCIKKDFHSRVFLNMSFLAKKTLVNANNLRRIVINFLKEKVKQYK